MPAMTLMFLAPVLPFRFPLLNLCVRDGDDALCQPFETLKWRFLFCRWLRSLHVGHYRISSALIQSFPSEHHPDGAESHDAPNNCFFGTGLAPNPVGHSQNMTSRSAYGDTDKSHHDQKAYEQSNSINYGQEFADEFHV